MKTATLGVRSTNEELDTTNKERDATYNIPDLPEQELTDEDLRLDIADDITRASERTLESFQAYIYFGASCSRWLSKPCCVSIRTSSRKFRVRAPVTTGYSHETPVSGVKGSRT